MGILMSVVSLLLLGLRFWIVHDGGLPDAGVGHNRNVINGELSSSQQAGGWECQQAKAVGVEPVVMKGRAAATGQA